MTIDGARAEVVEAGRWLSERGLAPGSSGNVSVRVNGEWIMTPTGTPLGNLRADRLTRLDSTGSAIDGDPPTKERSIHLAVYERRPDVAAVVHLHSTHAVALSCLADLDPEELLAPLTPYQVMRVYPIGLVPYARPGSEELAAGVRDRAGTHTALLLLNHGSLVSSGSLEEAVFAAEELEQAATVRLLTDGRPVRRLGPGDVDEIRRHLKR